MTAILAILNTVPGASSGGTLTVSTDTNLASALVTGGGSWETNTVTASASGGSGGYSFAWAYVSGAVAPAPTAASSAATAWILTTSGQIVGKTAIWQVTATDGAAHTATTYVTVEFDGTL
jgi:hypothetical protein